MLLFLVFSFSCTKGIDPVVKLSLKTNDVSELSGSQFVNIVAEGDWELSISTESQSDEIDWVWLTVWGNEEEMLSINSSQSLGKPVTLHYAKNNSTVVRTCRLTLTCGSEVAVCTLSQNRSASEVIVSDDDVVGFNSPPPGRGVEIAYCIIWIFLCFYRENPSQRMP